MSDCNFADYRLELKPLAKEDGGGYLALVPDLPGCKGDGATAEEALIDVRGAFQAWIETAKELGKPIPPPAAQAKPVAALVRFPRSLHEDLTVLAQREGISFNQYVITTLACAVGATAGASESNFSWASSVAAVVISSVRGNVGQIERARVQRNSELFDVIHQSGAGEMNASTSDSEATSA